MELGISDINGVLSMIACGGYGKFEVEVDKKGVRFRN